MAFLASLFSSIKKRLSFPTENDATSHISNTKHWALIAPLGVVFGDIGTSPLYALKTCFVIANLEIVSSTVIGITSLILWLLFIIVSLKYLHLVLKVNNDGEGGILALSACCSAISGKHRKKIYTIFGILGIALFVGDGMITPVISILSATEGIAVFTPKFEALVLPIAICIIVLLFMAQHRGSGTLGKVFGYIMLLWFCALAGFGIYQILQSVNILHALNPLMAIQFIKHNPLTTFFVLGGVILVVTGCEALYADLGHFGFKPIQRCWTWIVCPSLILNYLGQGALLLQNPKAISNPFYLMLPADYLPFMVILATFATVVASQAIISGIFSLTWQSVMLKYIPRLTIFHTSNKVIGQVYSPAMNGVLMVSSILLLLIFKTSENLAHAYGMNVATMMLVTTLLLFMYFYEKKEWSALKRYCVFTPLVFVDVLFLTASFGKIHQGAWIAIVVSFAVYSIVRIWLKVNGEIELWHTKHAVSVDEYLKENIKQKQARIAGVGVFFNREANTVPKSFSTHVMHNHFIHERVILLSVITAQTPKVPPIHHFKAREAYPGIWQIVATYGFKEVPDIHRLIRWATDHNIIEAHQPIWYYLSRRIYITIGKHKFLERIEMRIFRLLARLAVSGTEFYKIPHRRVVELGIHYRL